MSDAFIPFDQRPRPDADLAHAILSLDRCKSIEMHGVDEAATGRIFAWLLGQVLACRPHPGLDWEDDG